MVLRPGVFISPCLQGALWLYWYCFLFNHRKMKKVQIENSNRNVPAEFVAKMLLEQGYSSHEIVAALEGIGLENKIAREIVEAMQERQVYVRFLRSRRNMLIGAICCVFGCAIAAYNHATSGGDGGYILSWCAIILGCILFFKGQLEVFSNDGY